MTPTKKIGEIFQEIRERMGLTREQVAAELYDGGQQPSELRRAAGIRELATSLSYLEIGYVGNLDVWLEAYSRTFGVDPYVYWWVKYLSIECLPELLQKSAAAMGAHFDQEIAAWESRHPISEKDRDNGD